MSNDILKESGKEKFKHNFEDIKEDDHLMVPLKEIKATEAQSDLCGWQILILHIVKLSFYH